ncbi:MAG: hypothetical protein [Caudoviricetes sp.]|nr:MAG: hypothetical protein [Caudoviricetes sp.]
MSEFKGTKGVWIVRNRLESIDVQIPGDEIQDIGKIEDAYLIAAAPELLEACLRSRNQLYAAGYGSKEVSLNPTEELLFQLESAIKKALGK